MMSRKNYEAAAELCRTRAERALVPRAEFDRLVDTFCEFFNQDSLRFHEDRFRAACEPRLGRQYSSEM